MMIRFRNATIWLCIGMVLAWNDWAVVQEAIALVQS